MSNLFELMTNKITKTAIHYINAKGKHKLQNIYSNFLNTMTIRHMIT